MENNEGIQITSLADWMVEWNREEIQKALDEIDGRWAKILKECILHLNRLQEYEFCPKRRDFINFIIGETYGR